MITLISTKLYFPPVRPNLVSRPRLIDHLKKGLRGPLTLIAAPAGYGKSTLLGEWRAGPGSGMPVAWLSLDGRDNDPLRFWSYLTAALNTLSPGLMADTLGLLETSQLPPIESLLTTLINDLNDFPNQFVLVLDNVHVITAPEIHQGISFLVEYLPSQMHILLMSRADPPLALSRLRANGQLTEIRAHDLHFTQAETKTFLNDVMQLQLSPEEVTILQVHTEGWITGLQLAALSMQGREDVGKFIDTFAGSHRFILDFLVEEVLHQQPKDLQDFLLKTSILERFTGSLCDTVTGQSNGQATLEYLEQINLFLTPLDDKRYWYRYHNLFADVLRNRLKVAGNTDIPNLHHKASVWFESQQFADEAIIHAAAAQDLQRTALLLEQNALDKVNHGELNSLVQFIQQLPENIFRNRPWLCTFLAWGRYHYGPRDETTRFIQMAENALKVSTEITQEERNLITSFMAAIRAFKAIHDEDVDNAFEMAHTARSLTPEWGFVSRLSAMALGLACWGRGDVTGAENAMHQASLIALKLGDLNHAISGAGYEAIQQIKQGRLKYADQTLKNALALAMLPGGREWPNAGFVYIRLAELACEWNDLEAADEYINRAIGILSQTGSPDFQADAYIILARIRIAHNDLPGGRNALELAQKSILGTQPDPRIISWLDEAWTRLWIEEGNLSAMNRWANTCGIDPEGSFRYLRDLDHVNLARVWVIQSVKGSGHRLSEAMRLLDRLYQAAESAGWTHETIKICILKSLACQVKNDDQGMLSAMSKALTLAEPSGYIRMFIDEGEPMVKLLRLAGSRGITPEYVHRLISEFSSSLPKSPATQQPLIEPLSQRELEVLKLLIVGKSNQEIASQLVISLGTVKRHIFNIFGKMNVKSRTECAMRARELHLLKEYQT